MSFVPLKNSWLDVVTIWIYFILVSGTAGQNFGVFLFTDVDVAEYFLVLIIGSLAPIIIDSSSGSLSLSPLRIQCSAL